MPSGVLVEIKGGRLLYIDIKSLISGLICDEKYTRFYVIWRLQSKEEGKDRSNSFSV